MKNGMSTKLEKARTYQQTALCTGNTSPKPIFHMSAPVGWMNDPNGFSEYKGEKHLFFQYHPYSTVWGPMHWGHVKSEDFIRWENLPVALAPDEAYDEFGCYSGSAIEDNGRHILAYTGVVRKEQKDGTIFERQRMCIAIGDGEKYRKIDANPVIDERLLPPGASKVDFRDPKIWKEGDTYYLIAGNRSEDGSGQILEYRSEDLEHWEFVQVYDRSANRYGRMWECPDLFSLEDKKILMISPQEVQREDNIFHPGDNTLFILGREDETGAFREEKLMPVDRGLDFYAPQSMETTDGRRIMIGWLASWAANWFDATDGFSGMMTVPRELTLKDGKILQNPVRELAAYHEKEVVLKDRVISGEEETLEELSGRVLDMDLDLEADPEAHIYLKLAAKGDLYTEVDYDFRTGTLIFDRTHSGTGRDCAHMRRVKTENA
ncbi:MAG: glycoside hydrolase family 32 protein, partial [Lachnospiraceae bacterium]|nr:glycoside hydrolase family 32 protein [Lachnospiraceae bacterium]